MFALCPGDSIHAAITEAALPKPDAMFSPLLSQPAGILAARQADVLTAPVVTTAVDA